MKSLVLLVEYNFTLSFANIDNSFTWIFYNADDENDKEREIIVLVSEEFDSMSLCFIGSKFIISKSVIN